MKKVETAIEIEAPPEKVIRAFTDIDMLRDWWGVERALIEKRSGGVYTLAWNVTDKGFGYVSSGTIKNYHPKSLLEIENFVYLNPERPILGPMTLTIKLTEKTRKRNYISARMVIRREPTGIGIMKLSKRHGRQCCSR